MQRLKGYMFLFIGEKKNTYLMEPFRRRHSYASEESSRIYYHIKLREEVIFLLCRSDVSRAETKSDNRENLPYKFNV